MRYTEDGDDRPPTAAAARADRALEVDGRTIGQLEGEPNSNRSQAMFAIVWGLW